MTLVLVVIIVSLYALAASAINALAASAINELAQTLLWEVVHNDDDSDGPSTATIFWLAAFWPITIFYVAWRKRGDA